MKFQSWVLGILAVTVHGCSGTQRDESGETTQALVELLASSSSRRSQDAYLALKNTKRLNVQLLLRYLEDDREVLGPIPCAEVIGSWTTDTQGRSKAGVKGKTTDFTVRVSDAISLILRERYGVTIPFVSYAPEDVRLEMVRQWKGWWREEQTKNYEKDF